MALLLYPRMCKLQNSVAHGHFGGLHASHNVANNVIDWEYSVEILRSDLRARQRDLLHDSPPRSLVPYEGSSPQDPGASYVQSIPSSTSASGGGHYV